MRINAEYTRDETRLARKKHLRRLGGRTVTVTWVMLSSLAVTQSVVPPARQENKPWTLVVLSETQSSETLRFQVVLLQQLTQQQPM